jgi:uncharacterized protein YraI
MKQKVNWLLILLLIFSFLTIKAQTNYETVSDANFRKGPGTRYKSIGIVKSGEKVYVYDSTNPSWLKVEYNGTLGYMSSKLLSPILNPPITNTTPSINETKGEKLDFGSY